MIPKKIYQSWKTKDLPEDMKQIVRKTLSMNPNYEYELYDDEDCRRFLFEHFGINYVHAFDILTAGAFKCDFWRYAMLYENGGIYMDIDMSPLLPFDDIIQPDDKLVSVVDRTHSDKVGIYQAFVACVPKHPILLATLNLCFSNIVTRRSNDTGTLNITGPGVMATAMNLYWNKKNTNEVIKPGLHFDSIRLFNNLGDYVVDINEKPIFKNKFKNYSGENYGSLNTYYKDIPKSYSKRNRTIIFWTVIFLIIIIVLIAIFYRNKFKKCEESCNRI